MYLTLRKTHGYEYLILMESIHVKGQKYCAKRVIKNYGRYDQLPENVRRDYEDRKARKTLSRQLENEFRMQELQKSQTRLEQQNVAAAFCPNKGLALNYGHLPFRMIWDRELGLKYKIGYLQNKKTDIRSWQLNDLLFYLSACRVFQPMSYYQASVCRGDFFYCPWNSVTQDNYYRALDFVYDNREELIGHSVKSRLNQTKTRIKVAFFDCTNTWFETPYDDLTWQMIRFSRKIREELVRKGFSREQIDGYLDGEEFAERLARELLLSEKDVLRMRGCSKEGRFAQPIVTVALAIDQTGFPIGCKVFAGNISELGSIDPMLKSLRDKYAIEDVYFVADRGLNSTESLDKIQQEKLGFVVAQKVSMQKPEAREQMLDLQGYHNCSVGDDGRFRIDDRKGLSADAFRFKVCDFVRSAYVVDEAGTLNAKGKIRRKKVNVKCRIIYTFSPERRARDLADLEDRIARASRAVQEKQIMGNPCSSGWRALIQTQKEAAQNAKEKEKYRAVGLKEDVITERRTIAGYAAVVYTHPAAREGEKTQELTDLQVLSTYHKLVTIEDSFRTMKSTFSIRPVHVRLKERVTAHCYLCVLSLMLLRSLQEKLEAAGTPLPSGRIAAALKQALVLPMPAPGGRIQQLLNLTLHPGFHAAIFNGKGKYESEANELTDHGAIYGAFTKGRASMADDLDLILKAAGLTPPAFSNTMGDLKKRLGVHSLPDTALISAEHAKYLADMAGPWENEKE